MMSLMTKVKQQPLAIIFAVWAFLATVLAIFEILKVSRLKTHVHIAKEHIAELRDVNQSNANTVNGLAESLKQCQSDITWIINSREVDLARWQSQQDLLARSLESSQEALELALSSEQCADVSLPGGVVERLSNKAGQAVRAGGNNQDRMDTRSSPPTAPTADPQPASDLR